MPRQSTWQPAARSISGKPSGRLDEPLNIYKTCGPDVFGSDGGIGGRGAAGSGPDIGGVEAAGGEACRTRRRSDLGGAEAAGDTARTGGGRRSDFGGMEAAEYTACLGGRRRSGIGGSEAAGGEAWGRRRGGRLEDSAEVSSAHLPLPPPLRFLPRLFCFDTGKSLGWDRS